jgi:hypothetical protein
LRKAETVAAIGAGELAVNVDGDARFARAWAGVIGGEDAGGSGGDDQGFGLGEKAKRDADWFLVGGEQSGFAIEGINEDAAEGCGRKSEEMAAAHRQESTRGVGRKKKKS